MSEPVYEKDYFEKRQGNDPIRLACFADDKDFLVRHHAGSGTLLDVGCSTGEFTETIGWEGDVYGMEVSDYAIAEAKKKGISFERDLFNQKEFFDVIIFRGTIMHIDTPFLYIKQARTALKKGGKIVFLMTTNNNSIYYRLWRTLPALDPPRNFLTPSDTEMRNTLENFGYSNIKIEYPYWGHPYASPLRDHLKFVLKLVGFRNLAFPFWRNMMNIVAEK